MNKNTWIAVAISIFVVGFFMFGGTIVNLFTNPDGSAPAQGTQTTMNDTNTTGLVIQDETMGTGDVVAVGDTVTVNYVGTLENGTKFDSSLDRGQPFSFVIGQGRVIAGWEQGLIGMKVGGKRKLVIPASLGYGAQAVGPIPANSTLIFEIDLLGTKKAQ